MDKTGGSRLLQMQAKFQQKQLQERELKIASLYEAQQARALDRVRQSPSNGSRMTASSQQSPRGQPQTAPRNPGKVRQMFEERRTKAGIDKSYPLQPIHNTDRPPARKQLPNGYTKMSTSSTKVSSDRKTYTSHTTHSVKKQMHKMENLVNGSGDLNHNHEPDLNSVHQKAHSNGEIISNTDELDKAENNYLLENETFPEALAPIPTPRSPEPQPEPKRPPRRNTQTRVSPTSNTNKPVAPPRRATNDNAVAGSNRARGAMNRTTNSVKGSTAESSRRAPSGISSTPASATEGSPCTVCGRRFATDRLQKHEEICKKSHAKKRKPFDALKHRLAGTEAEQFIGKLRKAPNTSNPSATKVNKQPLNNNWRQKHEDFINAIRSAKQVQAHIKAGGKLSDLPPPPPSENPDYVKCPHCGRRFNQAAADRHIPQCANYQYNKPKPGMTKKR